MTVTRCCELTPIWWEWTRTAVATGRVDEARQVLPLHLFSRQAAGTAGLAVEGHLPGFDGATGWLNSRPLTA